MVTVVANSRIGPHCAGEVLEARVMIAAVIPVTAESLREESIKGN